MSTIVETDVDVKGEAYFQLENRIKSKTARFGVIGLGYVGLPLALTLSEAGFGVTGIDIDTNRVDAIVAGRSYITDGTDEELQKATREKRLRVTPSCSELAALMYGTAMITIVRVSSTRVAEMVKLLESTFRRVNIALVNEIALMCAHMNIDVWEVIKGASSKPFGFMPFYPGPGLGGHCIPIDPLYLEWKSKIDGFESRFIGLADKVNSSMPRFVVTRAMELLNERGRAMRGS